MLLRKNIAVKGFLRADVAGRSAPIPSALECSRNQEYSIGARSVNASLIGHYADCD